MAVQFMDSCDHYDQDTYITLKWNESFFGAHSTAAGRNGRGLNLDSTGQVSKSLTYQAGWVVGWAINIGTQISGTFGNDFYYQASHAGDTTLFSIYGEGDGSVSLYAGNGRHNLIQNSGTNGFFLKGGIWYWFDVKFSISGTSNMAVTAVFRVNTQPWASGSANTDINVTDLLLQQAKINFHTFHPPGSSPSGTIIDDIVIADQSGSGAVNDFFGDTALSVLFPRADVAIPTWTAVGSTTSTLFDHVNDQFAETNDDTIYIQDATAGDAANFDWQLVSVPAGGSIVAVHYGVLARKDAEGTRSFEQTVGPSGSPTQVSPPWFPGDSYSYFFFAMDEDPATGLPWTQAGFNATHFGVKTLT